MDGQIDQFVWRGVKGLVDGTIEVLDLARIREFASVGSFLNDLDFADLDRGLGYEEGAIFAAGSFEVDGDQKSGSIRISFGPDGYAGIRLRPRQRLLYEG